MMTEEKELTSGPEKYDLGVDNIVFFFRVLVEERPKESLQEEQRRFLVRNEEDPLQKS